MKKVLFIGTFFTTLLFTGSGCTPHDNTREETSEYLIEVLDIWEFTTGFAFDTVLNLIGDFGGALSAEVKEKVTAVFDKKLSKIIYGVAISYNTLDPFGNPVVATGVFFYPKDLKVKGVLEIPPIANMHKADVASLYIKDRQLALESMPCMMGYITLNPDFIGVRYTESWPRPYLLAENAGLAAYHFRKAVAEYLLQEERFRLPNRSTLVGYSLGGSTSLAIAAYYERNNTGITVDQIYTGGGVYDGLEAFQAYRRTERSEYQAIPQVIMAINHYYDLNLDFTKIFINGMENSEMNPNPEEGGDGYAWWFSGQQDMNAIHWRWGSDLRTYMHPDFFSEELKGEFKKLKAPLECNSIALSDWAPSPFTEVYLTHSKEDNFIPVEGADLLYKEYKKKGCSIFYNRTTGTHGDAALEFILSGLLYLMIR
ncbi:MAG: esterase family protein [Bacteroidales bacterium]|nr:esterase family protein [Bacteroidales bacterium]